MTSPPGLSRASTNLTLTIQHYNSNTHRTYSSYWRRFEAWAQEQGEPPLPAEPGLVCSYLRHLHAEVRQAATLPCGPGRHYLRPHPASSRYPLR